MLSKPSKMSPIPFSTFMQQSLYGQNGYYTNPRRVGKSGDFYTSVSASKFFGGAIASYILHLVDKGHLNLPLHIVEIGANNGYLLGDVALFLDALSTHLLCECEFATIEPLPSLREVQKTYFSTLRFSTNISFNAFESLPLPQNPSDIFILSNELFDSFPCDVIHDDTILYITQDSTHWQGLWQELNTSSLPPQSATLLNVLKNNAYTLKQAILPHWIPFIEQLTYTAKMYRQSYFLTFDYGAKHLINPLSYNPRFYHSHSVVNLQEVLEQNINFYSLYQNADITYDIDTSLLNTLFSDYGFELVFEDYQAKVLIEQMGILSLLESFQRAQGFSAYLNEIHKVKTLLHTMGGRFIGLCYKSCNSAR
ncbi:SAM-dependent methyltransferase [Helicobacter sp. MIT 21-1697]|uniref:SAM-dependent methyltransferase n=1 Tax=Helicobacter sp. MIT 21-1697 TaxID=2993733 RepID=UPI00224B519C|nr:SAM-dependent methyltransferase [Helicobacter sp. MIT 21-1697]MCX2716124.1 SAM-dependent methyltransferase [Helicobacter sp. MIT 21-1697]